MTFWEPESFSKKPHISSLRLDTVRSLDDRRTASCGNSLEDVVQAARPGTEVLVPVSAGIEVIFGVIYVQEIYPTGNPHQSLGHTCKVLASSMGVARVEAHPDMVSGVPETVQ